MDDLTIDINEEKIYNTEGNKEEDKLTPEKTGSAEDFELQVSDDCVSSKIRNINTYFVIDREDYSGPFERYHSFCRREIEDIVHDLLIKLNEYLAKDEEREKRRRPKTEILCFYDAVDAANAYPPRKYYLNYHLKELLREEDLLAAANDYLELSIFKSLSRARSSIAIRPRLKAEFFFPALPEEIISGKKEGHGFKNKKNRRF